MSIQIRFSAGFTVIVNTGGSESPVSLAVLEMVGDDDRIPLSGRKLFVWSLKLAVLLQTLSQHESCETIFNVHRGRRIRVSDDLHGAP